MEPRKPSLMNIQWPEDLHEKEYRHGLVTSQIEIDLPLQIRALRKQREMTQQQLAEASGMKQPRIPLMERPGGANFTLETLQRLAKAYDVALIVRFAPFSELLDWSDKFNPESFEIPSFDDEVKAAEETIELEKQRNHESLLNNVVVNTIEQWQSAKARASNQITPYASLIDQTTGQRMYPSSAIRNQQGDQVQTAREAARVR